MTLFRPCIDLHQGRVKQIVGGTLTDAGARENYVSEHSAEYFAQMYQRDGLLGGHVIQLGPGNQEAAESAIVAYPGGLQVGGGIRPDVARHWLELGASHVIVTSYLFDGDEFSMQRLETLAKVVPPENLVIDLSCRKTERGYMVATDRWQTVTRAQLSSELLAQLAPYCSEFLVHAADVEGLCRGIELDVVRLLGSECPLPVTYAGGARDLSDLELVSGLSGGRVDLTYGSALDVFGGKLVRYEDCVAYNHGVLSKG